MGPNWNLIFDAKERREIYPPAVVLYVHRQTESLLALVHHLELQPMGRITWRECWRVIDDGLAGETPARAGFAPFQWAEACLVMKGIEER
jgi:hypothetical protein